MNDAHTRTRRKVEITKERLITDLRKIGVSKGDHIAIALSFRSIGHVKGGPEAFIDALLEAVGPDGTIIMNTFTPNFPLAEVASDYIFDSKSARAYTGLIPETLRRRQNSIRSEHPTTSFTALGKLAKYLTEDHDANAHPYLPLSKLASVNGKYLTIGIGNNLVAIRHEAQREAGLFDIVPMFLGVKFRGRDGQLKIFVWRNPPCTSRLPELAPELEKRGIVKNSKIGMAYSILGSAREIIDSIAAMLRQNPTLNLCSDMHCLWCRDFERRMDLYNKVEKRKLYQRSIFVRTILSVINNIRLKKYQILSFRKHVRRNKRPKLWLYILSLRELLETVNLIVYVWINSSITHASPTLDLNCNLSYLCS